MDNRYKVLFFDVNETLLDLNEVRNSVAEALKGGEEVVTLWFEMMLHYSLVSTVSDEYHNFGDIGAAALVMLAKNRNIKMNMKAAQKVLSPIAAASPHPEVPEMLRHFERQRLPAGSSN